MNDFDWDFNIESLDFDPDTAAAEAEVTLEAMKEERDNATEVAKLLHKNIARVIQHLKRDIDNPIIKWESRKADMVAFENAISTIASRLPKE